MKATLFVDVLSHWCLAAVPAAQSLLDLGVDFELVYAPLKDGAPLGFTNEMETWFYERGSGAYDMQLSAAWCEGPHISTWAANAAAFAAGEVTGNQLNAAHAMMSAAMEHAALVGRPEEAYTAAASFAGVAAQEIERHASEARVRQILLDGNKRLAAIGADERPTWHLENRNGDYAILKGIWHKEAVASVAIALRQDEQAYIVAGEPPAFA
jgi:hypothetical protein